MSQKIAFSPVSKQISVVYTNSSYPLPSYVQKAINSNWEKLKNAGKNFTRGDVFTIQDILDTTNYSEIKVALTDYAHYLATTAGLPEIENHPCRVVHTSVLIKTSDNFLVFGEMADHTSTPKRLQCAGGGITRADIRGDNVISVEENARNELFEETGLNWQSKKHKCTVRLAYIKTGGPNNFVGMMFEAKTGLTSHELKEIFDSHNRETIQKGSKPEFSTLIFVKNSLKYIEAFLQQERRPLVDYLEHWLRLEAGS